MLICGVEVLKRPCLCFAEQGERENAILEAGKSKKTSKQQAMIKQFVSKAVKGDEKAFGKLIPLVLTIGAQELTEVGQALSDAQNLILERNARRLLEVLAEKGSDQ